MKVEIRKQKEDENKFKFPVLMKCVHMDMFVLFTSEKEGLIVSDSSVLCYSGDLSSCYGGEWKKFEGEITLKND